MWIHTFLIIITLIKLSDATCEIYNETYRASISFYAVERVRYVYMVCKNVTHDDDLHSEILTVMNNTTIQYVEVSDSSLPEINQDLFLDLNLAELRIRQDNVQIIQEKAFEDSSISTLILEDNQITKIKQRCFNSSFIYVLSLKNNSLNSIVANNFAGLIGLRKLNLQNNQIVDIQPESFDQLTSLEELNLSFNKLGNIPTGLFKTLKLLRWVYLNNNFIKEFNTDIFSQCKVLQYLYIQSNYLTNIDAQLYSPSILHINASENHLTSCNFSNLLLLDTIDLNYNKLTTTKDCLKNLPSLKFLYLNYNYLGYSIVNESFQHLNNLTVIEIDKNNLKQLDFKIFNNLERLRGVSLAGNNLISLDFSQVVVTYLSVLNLTNNLLYEVKNLSRLRDLTKLELSSNNFQRINYNMFEDMSKLKIIWLHNNSITTLELGCFRDLRSLTQLNLSYNKISQVLPGVFSGLKDLTQLDISHNNLSNFDVDIFHSTTRLSYLNIADNHLNNANVKRLLSHIPWLKEINLNGNNWSCISLVNTIRESSRFITLTHGKSFNVSNVFGIACNITNNTVHYENDQYLTDMSKLMNFTMNYIKDISYKMSINNAILIISLILFLLRIIYLKYSSYVTAHMQFVYKPAGEQEMQLI